MELRLLKKVENLSLWSLSTKISLSFNSEALDFFLLPIRVVWELGQSSGEPNLAFIGCKTGGWP